MKDPKATKAFHVARIILSGAHLSGTSHSSRGSYRVFRKPATSTSYLSFASSTTFYSISWSLIQLSQQLWSLHASRASNLRAPDVIFLCSAAASFRAAVRQTHHNTTASNRKSKISIVKNRPEFTTCKFRLSRFAPLRRHRYRDASSRRTSPP